MSLSQKSVSYAVLLTAVGIILLPLLLLLSVSLQQPGHLNPLALPVKPHWFNYADAFERGNLLRYFQNSMLVLLITTGLTVAVSSLAGYGLHHGPKSVSGLLFTFFLTGLILPSFTGAVPTFLILRQLHLLNTHFGLSLVQIASSMALPIFLFVQFYKTIPLEIQEAALVDGCGPFRMFIRIVLPLTLPVMATCIIIVALASWNDFFNPLVYLSEPDTRTLPIGLMAFKGQYNVEWSQLFAGAAMVALPIVLLYFFLQKFIIKGLVGGAVKG